MFRRILALFCVLAVLAGATIAHAGAVRCAGCKTEFFLIDHLKAPYAEATGTKLMPGPTGNKKAVNLLAGDKLEFAFTCKHHKKLAKKFSLDPAVTANWVSTPIARDPIVVVVNPDAGVSDLTVDQLKALFSGQVTNWSEVGGADLPVQVAFLDDTVESGVVTVFKEVTVGAKAELTADAKRLPSPDALGNFAKSVPGVVTFMGMNSYKPVYGKAVAVGGVAPERAQVVDGSYPLAVTYHVVLDVTKGDAGKAFLAYLATAEGQTAIDEVMVAIPLADSLPF